VELLREVHIVDTPGTNAIIREHEAITTDFMPRSDLVLFVTSAGRPFTETERGFMEQLRTWGKKIVIVINKSDILETESQIDEARSFVARSAQALLGVDSEIFCVSARLALRANKASQPCGRRVGSNPSSATSPPHWIKQNGCASSS
jgi:GTPase Era involved in 16S rRNA processing